ncbi:hypothetical protein BS17DRAFT_817581 [Gyrodon lividus]|nr:hypothetical protein BS17DRAFT_817581 [Gyrodon lividus]
MGDDASADEARLLRKLEELSKGIEHEDLATFTEWGLTDKEKIDDVDGFVDEIEELSNSKCQELLKSIQPIKLALVKIHKLAFKLIHSTTKLLPKWHTTLEAMRMKVTNMPRDVLTRWNSTLDMLEYALNHRQAVDSMTQDRAPGPRKYEPDNDEWNLLEQLHDILKILKDAMLYFSRATPNLATVIPAMDLIDEKLTTYSLNPKYSPALRAAVGLAKQTLNQYYQLTDSTEKANWEEGWIDTAKMIVQDAFECLYAAEETGDHDGLDEEVPKAKLDNIFDTMVALAPPKSSDIGNELECYLCADIEYVTDPLAWWYEWRTITTTFILMMAGELSN